jgi:hypothetical protein
MLSPLEPGRICAIGSFGESQRAWCATVAAEGNSAHVRVFHEATHVPAGNFLDRTQSGDDTHLCFSPQWLHEYHGVPGSRRTLLVGRHAPSINARLYPLAINLETLAVSVFPQELYRADHRRSDSYFSRNGGILEAGEFNVTHWAAPGKTWPDGSKRRIYCSGSNLCCYILPCSGWLYVPGASWYRLNPETFAEEMLAPGRLPPKYSMLKAFAVSAHYGLVAWGQDPWNGTSSFYQVTVLDTPAASVPGMNSGVKP